MFEQDGYLTLSRGHRIWYRRCGDGDGTPLLILHGGPGAGHDYLEALAALGEERPVIFYDQLGCGRSDHVEDVGLWTVDYFVEELAEVRTQLELQSVMLLGQSWGGWLALDYMAREPSGVAALILASTSASTAEYMRECTRLKAELPPDVLAVMERHEAGGEFQHPEYLGAVMAYYQRHLCRVPEWPDAMMRTAQNIEATNVYETMHGPNEFTQTGNLKGWDRSADLGTITVPTLITVGRHDLVTPACSSTLNAGIPGSEMVVFEESAHCAHVEESAAYIETVSAFLRNVDAVS